MNILVWGNYVSYYVWSSYILTQYSLSTKVLKIMDINKCAAIPLNMHVQDLRKYNRVFYTNTFYWKNMSTNARKMFGKI